MAARASAALVMPQILTRIMATYGVPGGEMRRAESIEACGAKLHEIVMGAQAGFADRDAVVRNATDLFEGCFDADGKGFEVTVVYTDNAGAGGQGAVEFLRRVHLDERLHAQLAAQGDKVAKQRIFKYGNDQKKAIPVVGAGFPDLPGIEDKILAK